MNSDLRIGITGGTGLIGKVLRERFNGPVALISRNDISSQLKSNEILYVGNFSDEKTAADFSSKINILIHAATGVGPRSAYEFSFIKDDLVGSINLARTFFKIHPNGHFIYLSSAGGIYDLNDKSVKDEESEVHPNGIYGAIKIIVENALEDCRGIKGKVTILRAAPVYGNSLKKNTTVGLVDKLVNSTINKIDPVEIFDNLKSARDYLFIDDIVDAVLSVMSRVKGSDYEIYNIGSGVESTISEVLDLIDKSSENKTTTNIHDVRTAPTSLVVNSKKINAHTGWSAKVKLSDGVQKMLDSFKNR